MKHQNIYTSNTAALYAIHQLYLNGEPIELDPMFNRGTMYGNNRATVPLPIVRYDLHPQHETVQKADARSLPVPDGSVKSVMLDPPWLINKKPVSRMHHRFTTFPNAAACIDFQKAVLTEAYRVCKYDGIIVMKTQDCNHNRRKLFLSYMISGHGTSLGLNLLDEIIVHIPNKMRDKSNTDTTDQCTSHSYYSKFLVFRKRASKHLKQQFE